MKIKERYSRQGISWLTSWATYVEFNGMVIAVHKPLEGKSRKEGGLDCTS